MNMFLLRPVACCGILVVAAIWYYYCKEGPGPEVDVILIVLSARSNFQQRHAFRKSLINDLHQKNVKSFFVIGSPCLFHPDDRVTPYSCDEWSPTYKDNHVTYRSTSLVESNVFPVSLSQKLIFTVLHDIQVSGLQIDGDCLQQSDAGHVTVTLFDRATGEKVIEQNIASLRDQNTSHVMLPRGFHGELISNAHCPEILWRENNRYVTQCSDLLACVQNGEVRHLTGLSFTVLDSGRLNLHINQTGSRARSWSLLQDKYSAELQNESDLYSDIIEVDVIDVYRNLPSKLLSAISWVAGNYRARFLMKTDDDCHVRITRILDKIHRISKQNSSADSKLWIGNFRKDWGLDAIGKWAEYKYTGVSYPWFACGSGYIISNRVMEWLSNNKDHLNMYQGEDISMGIWLSAIDIRYIDDQSFLCSAEDKDSLHNQDYTSIPDQSVEELLAIT